jgi:hypothetical protein
MSLANAFNQLLFLHRREATIERNGSIAAVQIFISPSNYARNLEGPEKTVSEGKEFVISKSILDSVNYPRPKRGDVIRDSELGKNTVADIREMYDFGGSIIGYRVRCE